MKKALALPALLLLAACGADSTRHGAAQPNLAYPAAERVAQVDDYYGTRVADPYRWLEQTSDTRVREWVGAENALAQPYLEGIPAREAIKKRLTELWNYERYDLPLQRGGRYFYSRNDGLQNQSVLYVADTLRGPPRVLLDPNTLSKDATIALAEIVPSPDGKLLAYSLSDGGTDWRTWRFRDVATGADLPDVLRFMKFALVNWTADSRTVYYARYPLRADGSGDDSKQREVYWHKLGTAQEADERVFKVVDHPTRNPFVQISDDFRYLVISLSDGSQSSGIYYRTLGSDGAPSSEVVRLFDTFEANYDFVAEIDDTFYVRTSAEAPNYQVISVPATSAARQNWRAVIPANQYAMVEATIVGGRFFAQYLQDAHSVVRAMDLNGKPLYDVQLPGFGRAGGFFGDVKDGETFFSYTDYLTPASISRLDVASGEVSVFRAPQVAFDRNTFVTEQVFYRSKDGTRVPMFITSKRGLVKNGQTPVMLYGYGGFNAAQQPDFSVPVLVWLEMGGAFAVANLRGGSEYGEAWHRAGTKLQKQNVFDDFIAAAQWLIDEKYTSPSKLAIRGRSNGGLLVGAVLTQRPDLFGAALPAVGVLDMLRYHMPSSNARQWSSDYGLSENEAEFHALYAYSPLHNVRSGTCYPPTLVTTADRDDRVVPWHSYKFAAQLQQAQGCSNPVLLRVETRAGHGAGKPVWMQIEDYADQWAFLVKTLHMESGARLADSL
ncbi:MAG TPA: prolyl oligopeptidase family serine peptidase [Steroidobacteraceae bacterium]|jgi:prolyl oligopeptidase|nr:prolyl oligopeptidase family serine peptidase [Steroidobacteraceae bacterium]